MVNGRYVKGNRFAGYTLCYTSKCIVEAMHVHASDKKLSEAGSAKLFVYEDGDTDIQDWV